VGIKTELIEAIEGGTGRVKIGDTTWLVSGDQMKKGTRVEVTKVEEGVLWVEAVA